MENTAHTGHDAGMYDPITLVNVQCTARNIDSEVRDGAIADELLKGYDQDALDRLATFSDVAKAYRALDPEFSNVNRAVGQLIDTFVARGETVVQALAKFQGVWGNPSTLAMFSKSVYAMMSLDVEVRTNYRVVGAQIDERVEDGESFDAVMASLGGWGHRNILAMFSAAVKADQMRRTVIRDDHGDVYVRIPRIDGESSDLFNIRVATVAAQAMVH